jgi:hypothetical protein
MNHTLNAIDTVAATMQQRSATQSDLEQRAAEFMKHTCLPFSMVIRPELAAFPLLPASRSHTQHQMRNDHR